MVGHGPNINVERLGIKMRPYNGNEIKEVLNALADPAFFPFLVEWIDVPDWVGPNEVNAAFEERWRKKREAREAAARGWWRVMEWMWGVFTAERGQGRARKKGNRGIETGKIKKATKKRSK